MINMKNRKKRSNSILIQALYSSPRPGQPLFSFIVFFSVLLDAVRILLKTVLCFVLIICASSIVVSIIAWIKLKPEYDAYMEKADATVQQTSPETFRFNETTILYYADGSKMAELNRDGDTVYLEYAQIPEDVINAFVAVEDRTFWDNPGIDLKSIVKVAYDAVVSRGKQLRGASTITQQLARCVFLNNGVSIDRKLQEMALSIKLTEKYTKKQIMEFYVNNIYFANGFYGIEAAAQGYFSRPASELTLSQAAYLCAVPNSPTFYDPYNDPDRAVERRDHILESMYDVGFISWNEMEAAKKENIVLNASAGMAGGYDVTYVADCAIRYFMCLDGFAFQYHFDSDAERVAYKESYNAGYERMREELYRGGYRIYTSIDKGLQDMLQEKVDVFVDSKRKDGGDDLQAAAVLSDQNGKVKAVVGGASQEGPGFGLNRAYQSFRQPGSSIKPLIVYTPALEEGYTADSVVRNISVTEAHKKEADRINKGTPYSISEMPGQKVTLQTALEKSLNGVAYFLMDELGAGNAVPYLEKLHFSNIVHDDYTMSASLGGLTYGASPVEMCGAYACLANGGVYTEPTSVESIVDRYGNEMFQESSSETIYTKEAAEAMRGLMEGVMVRGTGAQLGWYKKTDVKAYVKTGTTNNQKDGWMCGWTESNDGSRNVLAVWVGCDMPKEMKGLWGSTWPGGIWVDSMMEVIS